MGHKAVHLSCLFIHLLLMWLTASCLCDSCLLKETIPEETGRRSCNSEILERTQRKKAVQTGESLFNSSNCFFFLNQNNNTGLTYNKRLHLCFNSRSSTALRGCRRRSVLANSTSSIRRSGRPPSCCRLRSEDTWPGSSGSARETLWSSCRRIPGVCWRGRWGEL